MFDRIHQRNCLVLGFYVCNSVSFPNFWSLFLQISFLSLFLFSPSGTTVIQLSFHLMLFCRSLKISSLLKNHFFCFVLGFYFILHFTIPSSRSLIFSSASSSLLLNPSCAFFQFIYCILQLRDFCSVLPYIFPLC